MCKLNFIEIQIVHPESVIGQRLFESLKPFFVKPLKDMNTYCCIYHVELNELRFALNLLKTKNTIHEL